MLFMRVDGRFPKMTTGASTIFAPHVTRNFIDVTPEQASDFIARREFAVPESQLENCTGNGYVMLRFKGIWIGQGTLYMDKEGGNGRVQSMFPKAWSRDLKQV
jgi:NOL1/NOP2/fmu family ribosome biogenesis protein